jgi:N-methylhydantoinase A
MRFVRSADLRYFGQAWEVRVEVPEGPLDRAAADMAVERFHRAHHATYGYSYAHDRGQAVEWVNLRVTGIGPIQRPRLRRLARREPGGSERARLAERRVYFESGWQPTGIYSRERLQPGDCVAGPAIIEEFGSTSVIFPGQRAEVDDFGNLVLTRGGET